MNTWSIYIANYNIDDLVGRILLGDTALYDKLWRSQEVTGTFPNYGRMAALWPEDGYRSMEDGVPTCRVRVRCSQQFGMNNCPSAMQTVDNNQGVDIALIECNRDASRPWTRVATGNEATGTAVEVHWSHEVLNLSVHENDGIGPPNNFATYGAYTATDAGKFNNYHYRAAITNTFFPLISKQSPNGTPYKTTASLIGTAERYTDAYGCHGTSGSGVFPQNSDRWYGPVARGGRPAAGRLCNDPSKMGPGVNSLTFVRPQFTRQLEALSMVQNDR